MKLTGLQRLTAAFALDPKNPANERRRSDGRTAAEHLAAQFGFKSVAELQRAASDRTPPPMPEGMSSASTHFAGLFR